MAARTPIVDDENRGSGPTPHGIEDSKPRIIGSGRGVRLVAAHRRSIDPKDYGLPVRGLIRIGIESIDCECTRCKHSWIATEGHHGGPAGTFAFGELGIYVSCPSCGVEGFIEKSADL